MKKIAITGGKGGTGKSTFTLILAKELLKKGKRVVISDCDVECPNDHLLLGVSFKKQKKNVYRYSPHLIKKKCRKCGICAQNCSTGAIFQKPGEYPVFLKNLCLGCGLCWKICPFDAIRPKKEKIGGVFLKKVKNNLWLITGKSEEGVEETRSVVRETKKFSLDFAQKVNADYLLVDTAAGIHCPVIEALLGADLIYQVTEPTPMGVHDLKVSLELGKKLKIPQKIVINQANLGSKRKILSLAKKYRIEVEREIPYSFELAKFYSQGKILEYDFKESKNKIKNKKL